MMAKKSDISAHLLRSHFRRSRKEIVRVQLECRGAAFDLIAHRKDLQSPQSNRLRVRVGTPPQHCACGKPAETGWNGESVEFILVFRL